MAECMNYADLFELELNFTRLDGDSMYEITEEDGNSITVFFNEKYFLRIIEEQDDDIATALIYTTLYSIVAKALGKHFSTCKNIVKMVEDESELYRFACTFSSQYPTITSKLREELEMTNALWLLYKNSKDTFAQC